MDAETYFDEQESPQYKLAKKQYHKLMIPLACGAIVLAFITGVFGGMAGAAIKANRGK